MAYGCAGGPQDTTPGPWCEELVTLCRKDLWHGGPTGLYTQPSTVPQRETANRIRGTPGSAKEERDSSKERRRIFSIGGETWPNLGLGLER